MAHAVICSNLVLKRKKERKRNKQTVTKRKQLKNATSDTNYKSTEWSGHVLHNAVNCALATCEVFFLCPHIFHVTPLLKENCGNPPSHSYTHTSIHFITDICLTTNTHTHTHVTVGAMSISPFFLYEGAQHSHWSAWCQWCGWWEWSRWSTCRPGPGPLCQTCSWHPAAPSLPSTSGLSCCDCLPGEGLRPTGCTCTWPEKKCNIVMTAPSLRPVSRQLYPLGQTV